MNKVIYNLKLVTQLIWFWVFFFGTIYSDNSFSKTSVRTLLYPLDRPTGWCRLISGVKTFSPSGPDVSASRNGGTASWPGTGCMVCHLKAPSPQVEGTKMVTNVENGSYVKNISEVI